MTRVLALLVAAFLVAGAIVVRGALDDEENGGGTGRGRTHIVCATELRAACGAVGRSSDSTVTIEDAADTAAALIAAETITDIDVWIALEPWPRIVDDSRERAQLGPLFGDLTPVARSPLVVVGPTALDGCSWRCLGERVGSASRLRLGSRALDAGLGTVHLGAAAAGWFDGAEFATNDLADPGFSVWLAGFARGITVERDPVTRLLQGPFFDAALSFEAEASAVLGAASEDRTADVAILYPAPVAYLDVVVAGVNDASDTDVATELAELLQADGWTAPGPESNGLPRAGVLVALREEL